MLVRELTASESEHLGFNMLGVGGEVDPKKAKGMMLQCVLWGAVDEEGERLFFKKDLKELGRKSSAPITRLAEKIMEMSDLREKEEDDEDGEDPNEDGEDQAET